MSDVGRYEAVHLRYDDNNIRYGEGCEVEVVLASDYAALEAELAKLRAGQESVALQVVAHTQGNLMKSIGHFTDCRTDEGVTVGLIDTIINSARLLATRNLDHPAIVEAIKDLCGDSDVLKLVSPAARKGEGE